MVYAKTIEDYKSGKITRAEFCRRWAMLQGFDATVKAWDDENGTLWVTYRNHAAQLRNSKLLFFRAFPREWDTAATLKEFKIIIDIDATNWLRAHYGKSTFTENTGKRSY